MKKLPIGIQSFNKLISENYVYIDKTSYIHQLITSGQYYFLSRPRRFGKSLLISTLEAIFLGQKYLFKDLAIENLEYTWTTHPVIRLDMGGMNYTEKGNLEAHLRDQLETTAERYGVPLKAGEIENQFKNLILSLFEKGQVVVLIDEYDKPILDAVDNLELALHNRDRLKGFYGVLKPADPYLRFTLLTGVSKFSKVSVFSDLNNLNDITMDAAYASLLGYTQAELERDFADHLDRVEEAMHIGRQDILKKIKFWYNGYHFSKSGNNVYNPFSTLLFFDKCDFSNYWFETGTPTMLIKLLKRQAYNITSIEKIQLKSSGFTSYEVDALAPEPLLFQTGYITIKGYDERTGLYTLGYPNYEVESSFIERLMEIPGTIPQRQAPGMIVSFMRTMEAAELEEAMNILRVFFAGIPYDISIANEKYYQTIFYLIFKMLGFFTRAEVRSSAGRADAVVQLENHIYIFEFKLHDSAESALAQIKDKKYYEQYLGQKKPITLVGVEFSKEERNIGCWLTEELDVIKS